MLDKFFNRSNSIKLFVSVIILFIFMNYLLENFSSIDKTKRFFKINNDDTALNLEIEKYWIRNYSTDSNLTNNTANVKIFDLNKPLEPKELYDSIECKKTILYIVRPTICLHNIDDDVHVSGSLLRDGIWEPHVLKPFVDIVNQNEDLLIIDIGAQIGQYSLFAAQMGRRVLAVEPFHDNLVRLHKAATIEKLQNKIKVIQNAISNQRNEIKLLAKSSDNIGGQSLLIHHDKVFDKNVKSKYFVETILLDDLVDYLPKTTENKKYKNAILKIDIEGYEPLAFQHAKRLFDSINIDFIFMEWGSLSRESSLHDYINEMVEFLKANQYVPYNYGNVLDTVKWATWPWDIIWKKRKPNFNL